MIKMIAKVLRLLNSEAEPHQLSLALCFAMVAGFTPLYSLHNLLVLLLVLLLRVNLSAFILGLGFFSGFAYLLDPLFHRLGLSILQAQAFEGIWTAFYNTAIMRFARFNNSILMGSLVFSALFFVPLFLSLNQFIRKYRDHILSRIQKMRIMQAIKASKIYTVYQSLSGLRGAS